jgi:deoxyribose-phosphate aldolase
MSELNRYLDAAILKPEFTESEVIEAIDACLALEVFSVCIRPCDIALAKARCAGSRTKVCVVLGFPHGDQLPESKVDEAKRYLEMGVDEIDMVANYGRIRSGQMEAVEAEIAAVAGQTKAAGIPLKVIFETAHLDADAIRATTEACIRAGADFVKTSTGFNGAGAQLEDVRLMLETAAGRIKVKPSGGIRSQADAQTLVDLGVHRLGVGWTSCAAIVHGEESATGEGY